MIITIILTVTLLSVLTYFIWKRFLKTQYNEFKKRDSINQEELKNKLIKKAEETKYRKRILQELEDDAYYLQIEAEAFRQLHNLGRGWIIDIMESNLMRAYNIHDYETARFKNSKPKDICMKIINKELEKRKEKRDKLHTFSEDDKRNMFPLTPDECFKKPQATNSQTQTEKQELPSYKEADLKQSLNDWCNRIVGDKPKGNLTHIIGDDYFFEKY